MKRLDSSPASTAQWASVRAICCRTGDDGRPIAPERWSFFAELWVGPYQALRPEWTYIATEPDGVEDGGVIGYLTGCPDTRAFERARAIRFSTRLLLGVAIGRYGRGSDARRFVRRALRIERGPDRSFSRDVRERLMREFPAHLHVNLDSAARGRGVGRALVERFAADLRLRGVPGVHVVCGAGPFGFYRAAGFEEVGRIRFRGETEVFAMGKRL